MADIIAAVKDAGVYGTVGLILIIVLFVSMFLPNSKSKQNDKDKKSGGGEA